MNRSFRTKVATGTSTLPAASLLCVLAWLPAGFSDWKQWAGLAATLVTAYLIMEWNNSNALLRVRSRMTSTTFVALMAVVPELHSLSVDMALPLCMLGAYAMLFRSYQNSNSQGYIFHSFLFLGIGAVFYPPMAFVALLFFFCMMVQLRSFTLRTFLAGLLGIMLPVWTYVAYMVWQSHLDVAVEKLAECFNFALPDYSGLETWQYASFGLTAFIAVVSMLHFARTAFNDKIRVRQLYYVIIIVEIALLAAMALQPRHFDQLFRLFLLNSSPLIGHYYTLARGRIADIWFVATLLLLAALCVINNIEACRLLLTSL